MALFSALAGSSDRIKAPAWLSLIDSAQVSHTSNIHSPSTICRAGRNLTLLVLVLDHLIDPRARKWISCAQTAEICSSAEARHGAGMRGPSYTGGGNECWYRCRHVQAGEGNGALARQTQARYEIAGGAGWSVPLGADAWFRTRPHTTEVRRHVVPSACCVLLRATIERSAGCSDLDLDIWAGELGRVWWGWILLKGP